MKAACNAPFPAASFTAILRADRLAEALAALPASGVSIFPLWPRAGEPAKRVILQVRKGSRRAARPVCRAWFCTSRIGAYTPEADAVLRCGEALALT